MTDVNFRELRHAPAMPVNFAKAVLRARVKPGKNPQLPNVGLRLNDVGWTPGTWPPTARSAGSATTAACRSPTRTSTPFRCTWR